MDGDPNLSLAYETVARLCKAGVREFVLCSGNRCTPLLAAISMAKGVRSFTHFSERAAGFFALGRIKQHNEPVAVIVTSGTAVAELFPACIEAFYSGLALVLVTADRPKSFRGSGAPQAIEQFPFFMGNVVAGFDVDSLAALPKDLDVVRAGPVHINLCFNEPLISSKPEPWTPEILKPTPASTNTEESGELLQFLNANKQPLVILGRIIKSEMERVTEFLLKLGAPVYAEALSGLREEPRLQHLILHSGDPILKSLEIDCVLRIGSVPTTSFWRDIQRDPVRSKLPVFSLSSEKFSGLARPSKLSSLPNTTFPSISKGDKKTAEIIERDQLRAATLSMLIKEHPNSEPAFFARLSSIIKKDAFLYLGNSLPIREWDLFSEYTPNTRRIEANRGANGIDGQLSTFFGSIGRESESWCILGDLTAMYELEAPFILPQLNYDGAIRIVIVNNFGGKLFEQLPEYLKFLKNAPAANALIQPHTLSFEGFAKMWGLEYIQITETKALRDISSKLPNRVVVELTPPQAESDTFWGRYNQL